MIKLTKYTLTTLGSLLLAHGALAATVTTMTVAMDFTSDAAAKKSAGTIVISESKHGLIFTPHLTGLTPGLHGFHIHEKPDCGMHGMAANGHFDPAHTGKHLGPYDDDGHVGDLPALYVAADGSATLPVLAPRLMNIATIKDHALMIHDGGDNYSDSPAKLGGGGGRMICGILK